MTGQGPAAANRLITIKFSHYNEKARWALDRCGVPYREEGHLPVLHFPAVMRATPAGGRADRGSTRYSTPVLITPDEHVADSSAIAVFADRHAVQPGQLLPPDLAEDARAADTLFSGRLGRATRCFAYYYVLADGPLARRLGKENVSGIEGAIWTAAYPAMAAAIRKSLHIDAARAARSRARILEAFASVDERLADGRRYLLGDRFSLADLSFAALAAPALLVAAEEGYGAILPTLADAPAPMVELAEALRGTPAGRHGIRMFAEERG